MWPMVASRFIKARVPPDLKERLKEFLSTHSLNESAWLKSLVLREMRSFNSLSGDPRKTELEIHGHAAADAGPDAHFRKDRRLYVRLRRADKLLLDARATARGMRPATYLSVLARCHLHSLAPLPKEELIALKRCIGELGMIGRNLNQAVKALHSGRPPTSVREEFRAMLRICDALRENTKALLKANLLSWERGVGKDF